MGHREGEAIMPHRRKATKPTSVRLRAHRIPPTVLRDNGASGAATAALPVMDPSTSGVLPAVEGLHRHSPKKQSVAIPSLPTSKLAIAALVAAAVLVLFALGALNPFSTPQSGKAYSALSIENPSPHAENSTPVALWKQGTAPHLYSDDKDWADIPFGASTIGLSGSSATALAMVHVYETGSTDITPVEVAKWANENNAASTSLEAVDKVLTEGAGALGLKAAPLENSAIAIRQAVASGRPVVAVLNQGAVAPVASAVVITGVDQDSRLVVNDPTSSENTARTWAFDEVLDNAHALYGYTVA